MGFYGNISDTSRTHFQFDKIFSSRTEMDRAVLLGTDGIYAGRFVLVKYDSSGNIFQGDILYGFIKDDDSGDRAIYMDKRCTTPYVFTTYSLIDASETDINNWDLYYEKPDFGNFYFKLPSQDYFQENHAYYIADAKKADGTERDDIVGINTILRLKNNVTGLVTDTFYQCVGTTSGTVADWAVIINNEEYKDYFTNFQIDLTTYKENFDSRGYDATVWQKIYSEGAGKFILIARLNTSNPSFELYPDPPSLDPNAPYFDAKSTDSLYRIHVPSGWGIQFKKEKPVSEGGLSEERISSTRKVYNSDGKTYSVQTENIDADIYINKAGGNVEEHHRDDIIQNSITVGTHGRSGKKYYDETGEAVYDDTLEVSVHVPAIGNMVSDGYDLIYGYKIVDSESGEEVDEEIEGGKYTYPRNTDIEWINGLETKENKYYGVAGKKSHDLNTLAGTLNTMHDRLGQNVVHCITKPRASSLLDDYIYEINGNYYRRGISYRPITINDYLFIKDRSVTASNFRNKEYFIYDGINTEGNAVYISTWDENLTYDADETYYYRTTWCFYKPVSREESQASFTANKYYEKIGDDYERSEDTAWQDKDYYLKNINPTRYTEIELAEYRQGELYIKSGDNYICDNRETPSDRYGQYYEITRPSALNFSAAYRAGKYYKMDENGAYIRDDSAEPDPYDIRPYYELPTKNPAFEDEETGENIPVYLYKPNTFYYAEKDPNTGEVDGSTTTVATEDYITQTMYQTRAYYIITFSDQKQLGRDSTGKVFEYYPELGRIEITQQLKNPEEGRTYYWLNEDGSKFVPYDVLDLYLENAYSQKNVLYYLGRNPMPIPPDSLYLPGKYHYINEENSYIKDMNPELEDTGRNYYILTSEYIHSIQYPFYVPNEYYYNYNNDMETFIIATETEMIHDKYYSKMRMFVDYDEFNECPHGYEWNDEAPFVPPSIHLYAREEYIDLIAMDRENIGAPDGASINEVLLYLHRSYDPNNTDVRDVNTFRGALNTLQDLLYQLKHLKPGYMAYVNEFGQITSSQIKYLDLKRVVDNA